jgi:hypothetical protein
LQRGHPRTGTIKVMKINRRRFFQLGSGTLASILLGQTKVIGSEPSGDIIPALMPRDDQGHHFLFYSDCTSGRPGQPQEKNLQLVNAMIRRIQPRPEFVVFPGDAIMGYTKDYGELRRQWDHFYDKEMGWLQALKLQFYQSTSNHNTYDEGSEEVFREVHPHLPQNGQGKQKGLAYYVRKGNFLYISTHQPHWNPQIDYQWLDEVLEKHGDAKYKFVAGHYPVFPVNGYEANPQWCFPPHLRKPFWDIMLKHRVNAYLASHIIAFDVQVHNGLLQITSASAGSVFGPDGFMRGKEEYLHAVQMAVDEQGLRYQVHDHQGVIKELLVWPFVLPRTSEWRPLEDASANAVMANIDWDHELIGFRIRAVAAKLNRDGVDRTILSTSHNIPRMPGGEIEPLWIGIDGDNHRLLVRIVPRSGGSWQEWLGPIVKDNEAFDFQIVLHSGMGPGGVLLRPTDETGWSTLSSHSNKGLEDFHPPSSWTIGHGQSGKTDRPFDGENLRVAVARQKITTTG